MFQCLKMFRTLVKNSQKAFVLSTNAKGRPAFQGFCNQLAALFATTCNRHSSWNKAVSDAEKIVGYPTSFMSLRCLLSDEISNVALLMRKLVGTRHPLLKTARGLVVDGKHSMQTRGLLVLLISKTAGPFPNTDELSEPMADPDMIDGIHKSQRTLAEITEMIYTANLIHKGVVNLSAITPEDGSPKDMEFGNKMAVLSGDFLLASACTGLAELNNTKVVENISIAIGNLMEAEFTNLRDENGLPLLSDNISFDDWLKQTLLSSGSLIARSCQSAMELANHSKEVLDAAFTFGENIAYAHQLQEDLKPFQNPDEHFQEMTLTSAPVIKFIEQNESAREILNGKGAIDYGKVLKWVNQSQAVEDCEQLCIDFGQKARLALDIFPVSDAQKALINILNATAVPS